MGGMIAQHVALIAGDSRIFGFFFSSILFSPLKRTSLSLLLSCSKSSPPYRNKGTVNMVVKIAISKYMAKFLLESSL